jgi:hypothetical protein
VATRLLRTVARLTWVGPWTDAIPTLVPVGPGITPQVLGGASFVSVMETADLWNRYDSSELWRLDCPRFRRVLTQREVCSGFVIVRHKRPHMPMQRGFVEDNQVIQTLPPNRSDHLSSAKIRSGAMRPPFPSCIRDAIRRESLSRLRDSLLATYAGGRWPEH